MEETLRVYLTDVEHALIAEAQRFRQAFDRELGAMLEGSERERHLAANR